MVGGGGARSGRDGGRRLVVGLIDSIAHHCPSRLRSIRPGQRAPRSSSCKGGAAGIFWRWPWPPRDRGLGAERRDVARCVGVGARGRLIEGAWGRVMMMI